MFKNILFQIHWFLGITAGIILSIMGVTGAIYSYDQQILKWLNSESYQIATVPNQPKLNPDQIYQHFVQQDAEIKINSITIAKEANASSSLNIAQEGERRGKTVMINPYTAEVLPEVKGREFFQFIQRLHRYMTAGKIGNQEIGKQLTGACTLMLIYFVLSGLYLRLPKKHSFRQWFMIKPKLKGRNFIWDLHAVVGTWVIVFYLIFAMTGLYWSYDWWRNGMFTVLGVERPQAQMQGSPQGGERRGQRGNPEGRAPNERAIRGEGRGEDRREQSALPAEEVSNALQKSWTGFTSQLTRNYSSITFNLPKTNDGKLDITFVDAPAQHERARNNATYNYQTGQIEKLELYETKKLNERIMSSMLPVHRGSFMGGVYQFFAMLAALAMPLFLVTGWMLYLKRRKQKKLTQSARSNTGFVPIDPQADKWTILYASQTGMSEQIAYNTSSSLQQAGIPTEVKSLKSCTPDNIRSFKRVLFIASTYGTGEAPDLAINFTKKYMAKPQDFEGVEFAVLALGSKEYPETYCSFGHTLYQWLLFSHAQSILPVQEVDNGNKADLEQWYAALAKITHKKIQAVFSEKTFDDWQLVSRQLLNTGSQGEPVFEIVLQPLHDESWHAGDILEIQPTNSEERITHFLQQHQIEKNSALVAALDVQDLSQMTEPTADLDQLVSQLPTLPSREYSIANIPQEKVLRLIVRQKQLANGLGLGSGWLTHDASIGTKIQARIRNNPSFHLIDDNRPIICIGNGTGIAGLISLLKQREQLGFTQNWLIFGERERNIDFFYQTQIQTWQHTGLLQHVDLAFSRDQAERIYVQDKLREQQERLKAWIAQDAIVYICGSIEGMAGGVEQALIDILGEEMLEQLRQTDRYRRDVY